MTRHDITGYGGVNLVVFTKGDPSKPPLLLIHGWCQAALSWEHQFSALSDDYFVVAPDLRGHGLSDKPDAPEAYNTAKPWADDIKAIIDGLNLIDPVIVGWSMGGYVVEDYLMVHGEDAIAGTVLIGTGITRGSFMPRPALEARAADNSVSSADLISEDPAKFIAATLAFIEACTAKPMSREDFAKAAAFNAMCPAHIRGLCRQRPEDYRPTMANLTKPVMVAWGDQERLAHRSMFDETMATIPNAKPSIYEGLGHMPFFEDPTSFNADLAAFASQARTGAFT